MKDKYRNGNVELPCEDVQDSVLAHLDNEHDAALWGKVESHLLSCEACAEFAENCNALNVRLHKELKDDMDVAPLWSRISTALDAETQVHNEVSSSDSAGKTRSGRFAYGAIAAAVLVAILSFSHLQTSHMHNPPQTVTESINDFLTFRASGRKLDVKSSEPQVLRNWFVQRLDFEVPLSSTMPAGFTLDGARLCSFLNRRLASFMYHMGEKAASMYVMAETGLSATLEQVPRSNELSVFSTRGLTNIIWRNDGLLYVVVADFPEREAIRFAKSVSGTGNSASMKVIFLNGENLENTNINSADFLEMKQVLLALNMQAQLPEN